MPSETPELRVPVPVPASTLNLLPSSLQIVYETADGIERVPTSVALVLKDDASGKTQSFNPQRAQGDMARPFDPAPYLSEFGALTTYEQFLMLVAKMATDEVRAYLAASQG